jgi:hypothetical protein
MQRDDQALTVVGSGAAWASATAPASLGWSLAGYASTPASLGRHLGAALALSRDCGRKSGGSAKGKLWRDELLELML